MRVRLKHSRSWSCHALRHVRRSAFTLLELLLVVAVLIVVAALALLRWQALQRERESSAIMFDIRQSLRSARQSAIDSGSIVFWNPSAEMKVASTPDRESRRANGATAQVVPEGPVRFDPTGTASDARITIQVDQQVIGGFRVIGCTGAIIREEVVQ